MKLVEREVEAGCRTHGAVKERRPCGGSRGIEELGQVEQKGGGGQRGDFDQRSAHEPKTLRDKLACQA